MSMSTRVVAFKPPGEKWQRMKAAWDACVAADVATPHEVNEFFEYDEPDSRGVKIDQERLENVGAALRYEDGSRAERGFEIDVTKLPKDVTVVRFYNGW